MDSTVAATIYQREDRDWRELWPSQTIFPCSSDSWRTAAVPVPNKAVHSAGHQPDPSDTTADERQEGEPDIDQCPEVAG